MEHPNPKIEKYVHHGCEVNVVSVVKGQHRSHCLCFLRCKHFKPGEKDNCEIAEATYQNCVKFNTVTPVYECPKFEVDE